VFYHFLISYLTLSLSFIVSFSLSYTRFASSLAFALSSGLGRITHFSYNTVTHNQIIAPHHGGKHDNSPYQVIACTQHDVTIRVDAAGVTDAALWAAGWKFTTHDDHFDCPDARHGVTNSAPAYRTVNSLTSSKGEDGTGMVYTLQTSPASFSEFFETMSMKMHSTHMLHDDPSQVEAHNNPEEIEKNPPEETKDLGTKRRLFSGRDQQHGEGRRLHHHWFKKAVKWVKKRIIHPAEEAIKLVVTGKADKTWEKDFSLNWNYDKETGGALKSYKMGSGQTTCSSCFFHADTGYKVEIDVEHYKLQSVLAEVYGDVELELALTNPGVAVNINKLDKVMSAQLFSVSFAIGPVPITVSLNLDIDLGLRFTVQETGETPHVHAQGNGHIRFGKQYNRGTGWSPINSNNLDLSFDSAGGTIHADLYLYANIVPKLELHHIGSASVTVTPAVDIGLTAALPKADCDYKPLQDKHAVCEASEGEDESCALGLTVTPSVNVELDLDLDIELFHKSIYKKKFDPMSLLQKTFDIHGYPKCLIGSWSKSNGRRRRSLLRVLSGIPNTSPYRSRTLNDQDTTDGNFGTGIRNPALADPRTYLMARGANTQCKGDCNGNGFCVNATANGFSCMCQDGWSGDDCMIKVIAFDSGVSTHTDGEFPQPETCGHGKTLSVSTSKEYEYLDVCKGRTEEHFCASGNETEMKLMDKTVRDTLQSYVQGGYPCSAAMAELQCRLTFPSVPSGNNNGRISPISFESCVTLFTPCLGQQDSQEICGDANSGAPSRGYAGIASEGSPWNTTRLPALFDAEAISNKEHSRCVVAPAKLLGCPERHDLMVHVNTDVFQDIIAMDAYVVDALSNSTYVGAGGDDVCQEQYRQHLCQMSMPECNKYGNPMKMTFDECVGMMNSCPDLGEKIPAMYGLPDTMKDPIVASKYAKAVCSDQSDFFTRSSVGKHSVICGLEAPMLSVPMPWHQDISIIGPVCALAGLLVGVSVMAAVYMVKNKQQQQQQLSAAAATKSPSTTGHQANVSMTNVAYPALSDGEEMPLQEENPLTSSGGPMPTNPQKLAQYLEKQALRSSVVVSSTESSEL
jgi:hypothetical protein